MNETKKALRLPAFITTADSCKASLKIYIK